MKKKAKEYSKYTSEELAEAYIFPHGLSPEEKAEADKELWALRKKCWTTLLRTRK